MEFQAPSAKFQVAEFPTPPGAHRAELRTLNFELREVSTYNLTMLPTMILTAVANVPALMAAVTTNAVPSAAKGAAGFPLFAGGPMLWVLLLTSAVAIAVFVERLLHYHRAQINSAEFLNGVRTVLKRDNVVEAISICDATPGPVARLVKTAILARDRGREGVREALEGAGLVEVPRLEEKLNLLATIAQIAPLMGLLGSVMGFISMFSVFQSEGQFTHTSKLASGVWEALICTAVGLAIAIPCHAGYNYLVSRVNKIVLDMEKCSTEILNLVTERPGPKDGGR